MKRSLILFSILLIVGTVVIVTAAHAAPAINPALQQDDYFQNLYATSDTVRCNPAHWDIIIPDLTFAGKWTIYPYGAKSKLADGINVKVKLAVSNDGWTESFFIPITGAVNYKNELVSHRWFSTAIDSLAVQAVFSTCGADSLLSYQFIMEGW